MPSATVRPLHLALVQDTLGLELEARQGAGLGLLDSEVKDGVLSGVDLSGNELPLAPGLNFNVAADWDFLESDRGSFTLHVDANHVDDFYFEVFNLDRLKQEGYWLANARLNFTTVDNRWQFGLWARNLAEKKYRTSAINLDTFGFDYSHIGAPRTYGADVTFRF